MRKDEIAFKDMKEDNQKTVEVTIEMTEPCYRFYMHAAKGNNLSLGDWMQKLVWEALDRSSHKSLTGYEYDEMQEELKFRIENGFERAHPALVYEDLIEEWHNDRFKEELEYAIEAEWFDEETVKKLKKIRHYIEEGEENWKAKISEPLEIRIIKKVEE